jgi:hypothetical protein
MELVRGHTLDWGEPYKKCIDGRERPCFWPLRGYNCDTWAQVGVGGGTRGEGVLRHLWSSNRGACVATAQTVHVCICHTTHTSLPIPMSQPQAPWVQPEHCPSTSLSPLHNLPTACPPPPPGAAHACAA